MNKEPNLKYLIMYSRFNPCLNCSLETADKEKHGE